MLINVVHSVWGADDVVYPGGVNEVEVTAANAPLLAGAAAAGTITIEESTREERVLLAGHVQSQEDGEAALAEAMGEWTEPVYDETLNVNGQVLHREEVEPGRWSGPWHDANVAQFDLDVESGVRNPTLSPIVAPGVIALIAPVTVAAEDAEDGDA